MTSHVLSKKEKTSIWWNKYYNAHKAELAEKHREYNRTHKAEINATRREYYRNHKPQKAAEGKRHYESNKIRKLKYQKEYAESHKPQISEYRSMHREAHRLQVIEYRKTHNSEITERRRVHNSEIKNAALSYYGKGGKPVCVKCGYGENINGLQLDHINGDGGEHRIRAKIGRGSVYNWVKQNDYPEGFQTLCGTCHMIKTVQEHKKRAEGVSK